MRHPTNDCQGPRPTNLELREMLSSLKSWVFGPNYQTDDEESINDEEVLEIACETETKILDGKISHLMEDFGLVGKTT